MKINRWWVVVLLIMPALPALSADEGKVYKYVDKSGKITYSQTPPADGKVDKVDAKPASRGYAGSAPNSPSYEYPRSYGYQEPYRPPVVSVQPQSTAQDQRLAALKAECERNRGTDCDNPAALQYLDSTKIPYRGRY